MTREEAIDIIRKNIPHFGIGATEMTDALKELIRELRESEDERIRKWLYGYFSKIGGKNWIHPDITCEEVLAWLEKQKKQKDFRKLYEDIAKSEWFKKAYEGKSLGELASSASWKDDEQKPCGCVNVESEYDKGWRDGHKAGLKDAEMQKPAEWSEEDEKMRDSILAELANHICYNNPLDGMPSGTGWTSYKYQQEMDWLTNRLKSLSPSWKPSEEQMAWLKLAIDEAKEPLKSQLEELYKNIRENLIWK